MRTRRPHVAVAVPAIALLAAASALAASALPGKTYEGSVPSSGHSEGHVISTHTSGKIVLKVSRNGRSVTVHFTASRPLLYCHYEGGNIRYQSTKPAPISSSGTFKASVGERSTAGPGPSSITEVVSGRFSGRSVRGTIQTHAIEFCGGSASFSATAR
jgi:hypothetical protein